MFDVALEHKEVLRFSEDVVFRERIDICLCGHHLAVELVLTRPRRRDTILISIVVLIFMSGITHVR